MTENMMEKLAEAKMIEMFGKRKEDMTLGELLGAISLLGGLIGDDAIVDAANYTLGVAIRNGDADKTKADYSRETDCL